MLLAVPEGGEEGALPGLEVGGGHAELRPAPPLTQVQRQHNLNTRTKF